jgi:YD repeat-containing protein
MNCPLHAANGGKTTHLYNNRNQKYLTVSPVGARTTLGYDVPGQRLINRQDGNSQVTTYTYDNLQRVIVKQYTNGSRVSYTYDPAGQRTYLADSTGTTSFTYYPTGQPHTVAYPNHKVLTYSYNAAQKRTGMVDPDGGLTTWSYDLDMNVSTVTAPGGVSAFIERAGFDNYPVSCGTCQWM